MYAYVRRTGSRASAGYAGICRALVIRRYRKTYQSTLPLVAEIIIPRTEMNLEVVTHEATHAAAGFVRRILKGADLTDPDDHQQANKAEELLCLCTGRLVSDIERAWTPIYRRLVAD